MTKHVAFFLSALASVTLILWATPSQAAPDEAYLETSLLKWRWAKNKDNAKGEEKEVNVVKSGLITSPIFDGLQFSARFLNFAVRAEDSRTQFAYGFPVNIQERMLSFGYLPNENIEVGLRLGLYNERDNAENLVKEPGRYLITNHSYYSVGPYGVVHLPVGIPTVEIGWAALYNFAKFKTKQYDNALEPFSYESSTRGFLIRISPSVVMPLSKNLSYVGGIDFRYKSSTSKTTGNERSGSLTTFELNIANVRLKF